MSDWWTYPKKTTTTTSLANNKTIQRDFDHKITTWHFHHFTTYLLPIFFVFFSLTFSFQYVHQLPLTITKQKHKTKITATAKMTLESIARLFILAIPRYYAQRCKEEEWPGSLYISSNTKVPCEKRRRWYSHHSWLRTRFNNNKMHTPLSLFSLSLSLTLFLIHSPFCLTSALKETRSAESLTVAYGVAWTKKCLLQCFLLWLFAICSLRPVPRGANVVACYGPRWWD